MGCQSAAGSFSRRGCMEDERTTSPPNGGEGARNLFWWSNCKIKPVSGAGLEVWARLLAEWVDADIRNWMCTVLGQGC